METFEIESLGRRESSDCCSNKDSSSASSPRRGSWWDMWNPWKWISEESMQEKEYQHKLLLEEASKDDFSDLEMLQFLQTGNWSIHGHPVVLVIGKHLPVAVVSPERLYRFLIWKLDSLARKGFVAVYLHSESSYWTNSPGLVWLWRAYHRFPSFYRTSLKKLYIVHPDLQLHASMWIMCRWMSHNLWSKVQFCLRLEFLWEDFDKESLPIPSSVLEHDHELEDSPLMDYGIITNKEWPPPGGPDLSRYQ